MHRPTSKPFQSELLPVILLGYDSHLGQLDIIPNDHGRSNHLLKSNLSQQKSSIEMLHGHQFQLRLRLQHGLQQQQNLQPQSRHRLRQQGYRYEAGESRGWHCWQSHQTPKRPRGCQSPRPRQHQHGLRRQRNLQRQHRRLHLQHPPGSQCGAGLSLEGQQGWQIPRTQKPREYQSLLPLQHRLQRGLRHQQSRQSRRLYLLHPQGLRYGPGDC
ncbi:hypothetical protein ASPSYDRAFT_346208 [Aspergillus sydowii CBS 593.65]|uniref:Uncharacterized protein n=1 Tax=Aspergillus sydowii CBS 593.65 TaxID=1036612 RepID=A0A1L9TZJ5_9EURO|nr:uncharacterized protein ASPSYDRAFT_346208 [Aspergillus sydowii CBS 593.65]OJJ64825.1 hypothetical protein ASPSYDRAFT_346208 [Aspergillus sydowii CBS 593.65]